MLCVVCVMGLFYDGFIFGEEGEGGVWLVGQGVLFRSEGMEFGDV